MANGIIQNVQHDERRRAMKAVDAARNELRAAIRRHRADEAILQEQLHEAQRRCTEMGILVIGYCATGRTAIPRWKTDTLR